ncbi:hypothetical protein BX600DRAFT_442608 [Xylariales sp. PMI_506]|nr:hypothetical protein BX600DRAFT_442608 [Xylariales sp. PMI_506]
MPSIIETWLTPTHTAGLTKRLAELTISEDTSTITRLIHTPWPLVIIFWLTSVALGWFSSKRTASEMQRWQKLQPTWAELNLYVGPDPESEQYEESKRLSMGYFTAAVWIFNFVRACGTIVFIVFDFMHGNYPFPSIGTSIAFATLSANALHVYEGTLLRWAGYVSYGVSILGLGLAVVQGVVVIDQYSIGAESIHVQVNQGCAGDLYNTTISGPLLCKTLQSNQMVYIQTSADRVYEFGWILGLICVVGSISGIIFQNTPDKQRLDRQAMLRKVILTMLFISGIPAMIASVMSAADILATFMDCAQATQSNGSWVGCANTTVLLQGDHFGFWNVWTADTITAGKSVFLW